MSIKIKVYNILKDGKPHRSDEIVKKLFGTDDTTKIGLFNLHARCSDLRKLGFNIPNARHDKDNPKLCWYQILNPEFGEICPITRGLAPKPIEFKQEPLFKLQQITY